MELFRRQLRNSVWLYALFLIPTLLWFFYIGLNDSELSRQITHTWKAGFWHFPGVSAKVSRVIVDGCVWVVLAGVTFLFWQGYCALKQSTDSNETMKTEVLRWVTLSGLVLIAVIPFHSSDLYGYLNRGFQQSVFHTNPYLTPIAHIPGWEQQALLHDHWKSNPCPYGFFFAQSMMWVTLLSQGKFVLAFLGMKLLNFFALLGTVRMVGRLSEHMKQARPWLSAFLFGANPLVLLHVMGNGHNDIWMVFLLLLALDCLAHLRWQWVALPALALSILTKYASLLALPFIVLYLIQQRAWKALLLGLILSALIAVSFAMPYVMAGQPWPWAAMLDNAGRAQHSMADMLGQSIYYVMKVFQPWQANVVMERTLSVLRPLFWTLFALLCIGQGILFIQKRESFRALMITVTLLLTVMVAFVSAKFHPWYTVMFLPLGLCLPEGLWLRRFNIWFSLFQIAGFTVFQNIHVLNVLVLTLLPLLLSLKIGELPCHWPIKSLQRGIPLKALD